MTDTTQIVLAKRPEGDVTADCFREETVALPTLTDGQLLIRSRFLSLLHAAVRARPAADRRLGRRGGRLEEPEIRQGRHRDGHAQLGDPHRP
jgi:hypothetical protein